MAGDMRIGIQDHDAQVSENVNILEEDIILARLKRYPAREVHFGQNAVKIAMEKGFFGRTEAQRPHPSIAVRADYSELTKFKEWDDALKAITHERNTMGHVHSTSVVDEGMVTFR